MLSSGVLADRLVSAGWTPINSRKLPICVGLVLAAAFTIPAAVTNSVVMAVAYISAALFFLNVAGGSVWGLVTVAAPRHMVASLGTVQNFGGAFGGAFAPLITGWIVEQTHSFVYAFFLSAVIAVVAALIYFFGVKEPVTGAPDDPPHAVGHATGAATSVK